MIELSDERINQLLSEAEDRLATTRTAETDPAVVVSNPPQTGLQAARKRASQKPRQNLSVRNVQPNDSKDEDNAGPGWFGLPKTDPNDKDLKRDMQLLQMRGTALDPKRHYKKESLNARVPRYAHVGRIVEGPTDFSRNSLTRKERKRVLVDELLSAEKESGKFKSKYQDIQSRKTSGRKAFYKKLIAQRRRHNH